MTELPLSYLKELAEQIIFISAFLGGFSAAILGTLIVSDKKSKILKSLILGSSFSAVSFIVAVFAMTKLVIISIPGAPYELNNENINLPRIVGSISFFFGILALLFVISISGWLQSKKLGILTSIIGLIGLVLIFLFI